MNDDYGKQGVEGAKHQLSKYGLELVAELPVNVADVDMKPHIMKLRNANAEAVLLFVSPGHVARMQGTGKAMNFTPQWMTSTTCGDVPLMMAITKGGYAGTIIASFGMSDPQKVGIGNIDDLNNSSLPLLKKYMDDAYGKHAAKDERWGSTFAAGFGYVEPFVEALKRCGRDLTREKLVAELEKIENFQGIMGRVSFKPFKEGDPSCRIGQTEVFLCQATEDAKMKILTDWVETEYIPLSE